MQLHVVMVGVHVQNVGLGVHLSRIFGKNYYTTLTVLYISINYNSCIYSYRHNYDCMCAIYNNYLLLYTLYHAYQY